MIQISITEKDKVRVDEIIQLLLSKRLVAGINLSETLSITKDKTGAIKKTPSSLIVGRTKASLFSSIEKLLIEKYGGDIPVFYALPITNLDSKHLEKLRTAVSE